MDPITNIFFDDHFTGASKVTYQPSRKKTDSGEEDED
jgi:hypothetical protein